MRSRAHDEIDPGPITRSMPDVIINRRTPLWLMFCSVGNNALDAEGKTAIKAAWGDRGGKLLF